MSTCAVKAGMAALTWDEIAEVLGISREEVLNAYQSGMHKLRTRKRGDQLKRSLELASLGSQLREQRTTIQEADYGD